MLSFKKAPLPIAKEELLISLDPITRCVNIVVELFSYDEYPKLEFHGYVLERKALLFQVELRLNCFMFLGWVVSESSFAMNMFLEEKTELVGEPNG